MLHLRPELVHQDKLGVFGFGELAVEALAGEGVYFVRPWHRHVPASAGGDARAASAQKGRGLIEGAGKHLAELLVQLSQAPWGEAFPYRP
jgi:creatinine amidohydrolase/Fe(II)-dependent formamide hydrolase-like protein